ncbi:hypothetical protein GCK72_022583 [Caenorhabditis remanei]|uniref:Uncharacterized protein n=2 Tax=Caenorhabditis remanei TaxID=31234 RepID=A0A6A5FU35_CAERE|nr:hypothetical protein GCK72_022583 [Caenorhabditis remanei]KAF1746130.1 hypothetical protein GCK72_022583 [Caenorhabditis remanei]
MQLVDKKCEKTAFFQNYNFFLLSPTTIFHHRFTQLLLITILLYSALKPLICLWRMAEHRHSINQWNRKDQILTGSVVVASALLITASFFIPGISWLSYGPQLHDANCLSIITQRNQHIEAFPIVGFAYGEYNIVSIVLMGWSLLLSLGYTKVLYTLATHKESPKKPRQALIAGGLFEIVFHGITVLAPVVVLIPLSVYFGMEIKIGEAFGVWIIVMAGLEATGSFLVVWKIMFNDLATLLPSLVNFVSIVLFLLFWYILFKTEKPKTIPQYKIIIHLTTAYNLFLMMETFVLSPSYHIKNNAFSIVFSSILLPDDSIPRFFLIQYWSLVSTKFTILLLKIIALEILITMSPKGYRLFIIFGVLTALTLIINGIFASCFWQPAETDIAGTIGAINTSQNWTTMLPLALIVITMAFLPYELYRLRLAKINREFAGFIPSSTKAEIRVYYRSIIAEMIVAVIFGYLPIIGVYILTLLGLGHEEMGRFYLNYSIGGSTVVESIPLIYFLRKQKGGSFVKFVVHIDKV